MKRPLAVVLIAVLAFPLAAADDRALKRQLIGELLEVMDAKALTQASFDLLFSRMTEMAGMHGGEAELDDEARAQWEAAKKRQQAEMSAFRERLFTRIDYAKYAEEIYAPLFDRNFNVAELQELLAFYKTKTGQKTVKMLPDLAVGGLLQGSVLLQQQAADIAEELEKEQEAKHPWKKAMSDLRTLATCVEAYATDRNEYPKVATLDELQPVLQPTYVRTMPKVDPWGTPYSYVSDGQSYRFASAGADKRFDWSAKHLDKSAGVEMRYVESDDADIIFQDGNFVQAPAAAKNEQ